MKTDKPALFQLFCMVELRGDEEWNNILRWQQWLQRYFAYLNESPQAQQVYRHQKLHHDLEFNLCHPASIQVFNHLFLLERGKQMEAAMLYGGMLTTVVIPGGGAKKSVKQTFSKTCDASRPQNTHSTL